MEMFSVMTPNPNISGVNPFKIKEMVLFHLTVWCHPYIYKGIDEMKLNLSHREGRQRLGPLEPNNVKE